MDSLDGWKESRLDSSLYACEQVCVATVAQKLCILLKSVDLIKGITENKSALEYFEINFWRQMTNSTYCLSDKTVYGTTLTNTMEDIHSSVRLKSNKDNNQFVLKQHLKCWSFIMA